MVPPSEQSASHPAVTVVAQQVAVAYGVTLTSEAANSVYNDIYRIAGCDGSA